MDVTVEIKNTISIELSLQAPVHVSGEITAGSCPIINSIYGGDAGDDSQFTPINGLLNGGTA